MKLSYKVNIEKADQAFEFPIGRVSYDGKKRLHLGSMVIEKSAQLSNAQVLAILSEVVTYSNTKVKIEFEDITLEFE